MAKVCMESQQQVGMQTSKTANSMHMHSSMVAAQHWLVTAELYKVANATGVNAVTRKAVFSLKNRAAKLQKECSGAQVCCRARLLGLS